MRSTRFRYQNDDVIDVEVKTESRVHKYDKRYWSRPVRNCDDMAYAQKQYAAKAPFVVLALTLLKVIALALL